MTDPPPAGPEMGRAEAASAMRRIEIRGGGGIEHAVVTVDGEPTSMRFDMSSHPGISFPAVWLDGRRVYAVEVWNEDGLLLAVPPRSDDVEAAFDQHEHLRHGGDAPA